MTKTFDLELLLSLPDPLAEAASLLRLRRDGVPANGQHPALRVLGRCAEVGDCWEWQGHRLPPGYGQVRRDGRMQPAHRVVFTELHGALAPDVFVCHTCDNPPCCNPAHLFAGTATDNNRDRHAKGRTRGLQPGDGRANRNKTHCKHGHEFTPENTRVRPADGSRACLTCQRIRHQRAVA